MGVVVVVVSDEDSGCTLRLFFFFFFAIFDPASELVSPVPVGEVTTVGSMDCSFSIEDCMGR